MLSEGAAVEFTFAKRGVRSTMKAGGFVVSGRRGLNVVPFRGKIPGQKELSPGNYAVTVVAIDLADKRSSPRRLTFRILRSE